jgi:pyruvate formate lyase activating enzyme
MEIVSIIRDSLIDFPGKNALVVFSKGCNFNCPSCYAKQINQRNETIDPIKYIGDWTDGVVLLGGEPTIDKNIIDFAKELKKNKLSIKLDTNGSNPETIKTLLEKKLVDYIAMDLKNNPAKYDITSGTKVNIKNIEESMKIITNSGIEHEFRTTIVPIIDEKPEWLNKEDIISLAKWIVEITGKNNHKYYLQKFLARPIEEMIDSRYSLEELDENFHETPKKILLVLKDSIKEILPNCSIRGED